MDASVKRKYQRSISKTKTILDVNKYWTGTWLDIYYKSYSTVIAKLLLDKTITFNIKCLILI